DVREVGGEGQRLAADAARRAGDGAHRRGDVVNGDVGAAGGAGVVLVGDGGAYREGSVTGIVVEILMTGAESQHARGQVEGRVSGAIAPVDHDRVRVLGARIAETAADGRRVVLVDRRRAGAQRHTRRRHVVDRDRGRGGCAGAVLVGDGGADGEGRVVGA